MTKILIIYPQLDISSTGGQIIDFIFIEQLKNSPNFECNYLLNKDVRNLSIFGYVFYTIRHLRKIASNDIIFANSRYYTRLLLCFLLLRFLKYKNKIVLYHHHFNYQTQKGFKRFLHRFLELTFLKISGTVIIPSPYVNYKMQRLLPRVNTKYIEIGFDIKLDYKENKILTNNLLFVGTIEKRKQVHHLIMVAQFLKMQGVHFHISIIGKLIDTIYADYIKDEINRAGLSEYVKLKGRLSSEELVQEYRQADVFLFPSSYEGYGMVLVEAMSYGLPVVAYNNSAIPYSVKDGINGMLAMNGDVQDFCNKLYKILSDDSYWRILRYNAYNYSKERPTLEDMKENMKCYIDNEINEN